MATGNTFCMYESKALFICLPVNDIAQSRLFWSRIGFRINETFSDKKITCIEFKKDCNYLFLIDNRFFQEFSQTHTLPESRVCSVQSILMHSREEVDMITQKAIELGAVRKIDPIDHGWIYYETIVDPDNFQWQFLFLDSEQV